MKRAVVPGTFDPITKGHIDVIERAAQVFDEVIVAVAASHKKGPIFDQETRVRLAEEALKEYPNVCVKGFNCLLVDFVREQKAHIVVKGLRAITDFEYEFQMAMLNFRLAPELETLFVMSSPDYMYVSSSIAKELALLHGSTEGIVPPVVGQALANRLG